MRKHIWIGILVLRPLSLFRFSRGISLREVGRAPASSRPPKLALIGVAPRWFNLPGVFVARRSAWKGLDENLLPGERGGRNIPASLQLLNNPHGSGIFFPPIKRFFALPDWDSNITAAP